MKNLRKILFLIIAIVMMASIFGSCVPLDKQDVDDNSEIHKAAPVTKYITTSADDMGSDVIGHADFRDDDYYYYMFYLGKVEYVPLQQVGEYMPYAYNGNNYTRSFSTTKANSKTIEAQSTYAATNSFEQHHDFSFSYSVEIGTGIIAEAFVKNKHTFEFGYSGGFKKSESSTWTDSYSNAETNSYSETDSITFSFDSSSKIGFYRYILFGTVDVYKVIVLDPNTHEYDVVAISDVVTQYYCLDYSKSSTFDDNVIEKLPFDPSNYEIGYKPETYYPSVDIKIPEPDSDQDPEVKKIEVDKIQISAGWDYSLMLDTKGDIYAWGLNDCYQLGDGTTTSRTVPTKVPTGTIRFKQISAGYKHSLAIDTEGNIWAWGLGESGQVGNGTKTNQKTPKKVTTGTVFIKISAGAYHNLAIDASGNMWYWGAGEDYRLGTGSTADQTSPKMFQLSTRFIEVAAGRYHSLAIDTLGNIWSWGLNSDGELGNNSTSTVKVPTKISVSIPGTKFTKISAVIQCLAIDSKGNLWVWGAGEDYRIGFGSTTDKKVPTIVPQVGTCVDIIAGRYHSLVVDSSGNIWATGSDSNGKLGNGTAGTYKEFTKITVEGTLFAYVAAGEEHSFAIATDGSLWSWGSGANGRTGHGNTTKLQAPKKNEIATYILQNFK